MSKRIDITRKIFNNIYILEYIGSTNTHAKYKCLCMPCNTVIHVTRANLVNGNSKSCQKCGNKRVNYIQEHEIHRRLKNGDGKSQIAREMNLSRNTIYRVAREWADQ
ncbi:MAG: 7 protein [Campylobacterota bacterium]|nr:7 protein [Campylobacterota bacterium]